MKTVVSEYMWPRIWPYWSFTPLSWLGRHSAKVGQLCDDDELPLGKSTAWHSDTIGCFLAFKAESSSGIHRCNTHSLCYFVFFSFSKRRTITAIQPWSRKHLQSRTYLQCSRQCVCLLRFLSHSLPFHTHKHTCFSLLPPNSLTNSGTQRKDQVSLFESQH